VSGQTRGHFITIYRLNKKESYNNTGGEKMTVGGGRGKIIKEVRKW